MLPEGPNIEQNEPANSRRNLKARSVHNVIKKCLKLKTVLLSFDGKEKLKKTQTSSKNFQLIPFNRHTLPVSLGKIPEIP